MLIVFNDRLKLDISEEILGKFHNKEQRIGTNESGGILLGKYELITNTYCISDITLPSKNDLSGHSFFIRNKKNAQRVIDKSWNNSQGIVNYIGEWHTHCCQFPTPSSTDAKLMRQIYDDKVCPFNYFFMIIVGQNKNLYIRAINTFEKFDYSISLQKSINYGGV